MSEAGASPSKEGARRPPQRDAAEEPAPLPKATFNVRTRKSGKRDPIVVGDAAEEPTSVPKRAFKTLKGKRSGQQHAVVVEEESDEAEERKRKAAGAAAAAAEEANARLGGATTGAGRDARKSPRASARKVAGVSNPCPPKDAEEELSKEIQEWCQGTAPGLFASMAERRAQIAQLRRGLGTLRYTGALETALGEYTAEVDAFKHTVEAMRAKIEKATGLVGGAKGAPPPPPAAPPPEWGPKLAVAPRAQARDASESDLENIFLRNEEHYGAAAKRVARDFLDRDARGQPEGLEAEFQHASTRKVKTMPTHWQTVHGVLYDKPTYPHEGNEYLRMKVVEEKKRRHAKLKGSGAKPVVADDEDSSSGRISSNDIAPPTPIEVSDDASADGDQPAVDPAALDALWASEARILAEDPGVAGSDPENSLSSR